MMQTILSGSCPDLVVAGRIGAEEQNTRAIPLFWVLGGQMVEGQLVETTFWGGWSVCNLVGILRVCAKFALKHSGSH